MKACLSPSPFFFWLEAQSTLDETGRELRLTENTTRTTTPDTFLLIVWHFGNCDWIWKYLICFRSGEVILWPCWGGMGGRDWYLFLFVLLWCEMQGGSVVSGLHTRLMMGRWEERKNVGKRAKRQWWETSVRDERERRKEVKGKSGEDTMKGEGSKKKERSKVWRNKGSLWRSTLISLGSPFTHTGVHAHTHAHMHALKHAHMHTHNPYKYAPRTHHTHFSCPSWGGVKKIFSFLVTPHTPTSTHIQRVLLRWVLIRSKGGGLLVISKQNKQNRRT